MSDLEETRLGRIAIRNDLITEAQLDRCLSIQSRLAEMGISRSLGEILKARRTLSEKDIEALLTLQGETRRVLKSAVEAREPGDYETAGVAFGQLAVRNRLLPRAKLEDCLETQREARALGVPIKIGEILVEKGCLSRGVVETILHVQKRNRMGWLLAWAACLTGIALLSLVASAIVPIGESPEPVFSPTASPSPEAREEGATPGSAELPRSPRAKPEPRRDRLETGPAAASEERGRGRRNEGAPVPSLEEPRDLEESRQSVRDLLSGDDPEAYDRWVASQRGAETEADRTRREAREAERSARLALDRLTPEEFQEYLARQRQK